MIRCLFHRGEAVRRNLYHNFFSAGVASLRSCVERGRSFLFRGKKVIPAASLVFRPRRSGLSSFGKELSAVG